MKTTCIFLGLVAVVGWNAFLIKRDTQLFKAYDKACAELPKYHPDCQYAK